MEIRILGRVQNLQPKGKPGISNVSSTDQAARSQCQGVCCHAGGCTAPSLQTATQNALAAHGPSLAFSTKGEKHFSLPEAESLLLITSTESSHGRGKTKTKQQKSTVTSTLQARKKFKVHLSCKRERLNTSNSCKV